MGLDMPLNFDILFCVMRVASSLWWRDIVLAMMHTCRTLYYQGSELLLTGEIALTGERSIASFSHAMLTENIKPATRPRQFRDRLHLRLVPDVLTSPSVLEDFSRVLRLLVHLRSLHIDSLDQVLQCGAHVSSALATLPSLEDLMFRTVFVIPHKRLATFVRKMHSPLTTVRLYLDWIDNGRKVVYRREADPTWILANFAATLEVVGLSGRLTFGSTLIYPRVRLVHMNSNLDLPLLRSYITSFPNLRDFRIVSRPSLMEGRFDHAPRKWAHSHAERELYRAKNKEDQLTHQAWISLDTLVTDCITAYVLGFSCRVRTLHLLVLGETTKPFSELAAMMMTVLKDVRPQCLRLAFFRREIIPVLTFISEHVPPALGLSSLELRLNIHEYDPFNMSMYLVSCS